MAKQANKTAIKINNDEQATGPEKRKHASFVTVVSWASENDFLDAKKKAAKEGVSLAAWLLHGRGYKVRSVGAPPGNSNNLKGRPKDTRDKSKDKND